LITGEGERPTGEVPPGVPCAAISATGQIATKTIPLTALKLDGRGGVAIDAENGLHSER
jgi:hypothetical protein